MDVISALTGLKHWENLASCLKVPEWKSSDIQKSTYPLYEVIKYWKEKGDFSWKDLAVALEQCDESRIAYRIKRKYLKVKLVILYPSMIFIHQHGKSSPY